MKIQLQHGDDTYSEDVSLSTNGRAYCCGTDEDIEDQPALRVGNTSPGYDRWLLLREIDGQHVGSTEAQMQAFCQAVAQQVEPLMFLAHSLRLSDLQDRMRAFVAACCLANADSKGLLHGQLESVFTDRVFQVVLAPGADSVAKMDFVENCLTWACSFKEGEGLYQMLRPAPGSGVEPLRVLATLTQDFMGAKEGELVEVVVDLLDEGTITIGDVVLPAQLLIGQAVPCDEDYRLLMTGKEDEQSSEEGDE